MAIKPIQPFLSWLQFLLKSKLDSKEVLVRILTSEYYYDAFVELIFVIEFRLSSSAALTTFGYLTPFYLRKFANTVAAPCGVRLPLI
jgi:hypothetical protein